MRKEIHKASERGISNIGWLNSAHSFSFSNYYNPARMGFGKLRVLNDDQVAPGMGFGTHPHQNMEIISIPLNGTLEHRDSMGNVSVIEEGDIQVMSAGTGVEHSEINKSKTAAVEFLQIWVVPEVQNATPRYQQVKLSDLLQPNTFSQILSPNEEDQGVWIHQQAYFSMGDFEKDSGATYRTHKASNGIYMFVVEGEIETHGEVLLRRDAIAMADLNEISIKTNEKSKVLLMEIPLN